MDRDLVIKLYGFAQVNKNFGKLVNLVYKLSPFVFFTIYLSGGIYLFMTHRIDLPRYVLTPMASLLSSYGLRRIIKRKRPCNTLELIPEPKKKDSYSCPSNHASSAGVIALSMLMINVSLGVIACLMAMCTGLSRVFIAVHYPSDVIAGFALAGFFVYIGNLILV